jgi:hypothetical protein
VRVFSEGVSKDQYESERKEGRREDGEGVGECGMEPGLAGF